MAKSLADSSKNYVVTVSGKTVPRSKCRLIDDIYYEIDVDVFLVDNKYYRKNTGKIIQHYVTKQWVKTTDASLKQFRTFFIDGELYVIDSTDTPQNSIVVSLKLQYYEKFITVNYVSLNFSDLFALELSPNGSSLSSREVIIKTYNPKKIDDPFVKVSRHLYRLGNYFQFCSRNWLPNITEYTKFANLCNNKSSGGNLILSYPFTLTYNFTDNSDYITQIINKGPYVAKNPCDFAKEYSSHFEGFTYGIEYETLPGAGVINPDTLKDIQWVPLRDGSLRVNGGEGVEYVSSILTSKNVVQNVIDFMHVVKENDIRTGHICSIHVNIGIPGFNPVKQHNAVELYCTALKVQDQVFELLAPYKSSHSYQKILAKNYCKKLPNGNILNMNDAAKFKFVENFLMGGENVSSEYGIIKGRHPGDGQNKWDNHMRYYWFNMLPLYFGKKKGVLEYRPLEPTRNFETLFCWMVLFKSITQYALNPENRETILSNKSKIDLFDIIDDTIKLPNLRALMINFINAHKNRYIKDVISNRDTTSLSDAMVQKQLAFKLSFDDQPNISNSNVQGENIEELYENLVKRLNSLRFREFVNQHLSLPEFQSDLRMLGFAKPSNLHGAYNIVNWISIASGQQTNNHLMGKPPIFIEKISKITKGLPLTYKHLELALVLSTLAYNNDPSDNFMYRPMVAANLVVMERFMIQAKKYGYALNPDNSIIYNPPTAKLETSE